MELTISSLENLKLKELYELAKTYKVSYYSKLTKKELIFAILKARRNKKIIFFMEGVLEIIQSRGLWLCSRLTIHQARKISTFQHRKSVALICQRG